MKWGWKRRSTRFPRGSIVDGDGRRRNACAIIDDSGSGDPCGWVGSQLITFRDGSKLWACHAHKREIRTTADEQLLAAAVKIAATDGSDPRAMLVTLERIRNPLPDRGFVRSEYES